MCSGGHRNQDFVDKELELVRKKLTDTIEGSELISCHRVAVHVRLTCTKYKALIAQLLFSPDYPETPILAELKSKTITEKVLDKLTQAFDQEAKKHVGAQQVIPMVQFVRKCVDDNPFIICSEELNHIKTKLITANDTIKIKQKAGVLSLTINQNRYSTEIKFVVPDLYPAEAVKVECKETNLPSSLSFVFFSQAKEMCRQCIQQPLKKKPRDPPFEPKPSLRLAADFLVNECCRRAPTEQCPVCNELCLPEDPKDCQTNPNDPYYIERVYCSHLFHFGCLDRYMKTPPFTGGKKCPSCSQRIYHERWNITPKLAEDRWAHKQARERELDEVKDFLGDMAL